MLECYETALTKIVIIIVGYNTIITSPFSLWTEFRDTEAEWIYACLACLVHLSGDFTMY